LPSSPVSRLTVFLQDIGSLTKGSATAVASPSNISHDSCRRLDPCWRNLECWATAKADPCGASGPICSSLAGECCVRHVLPMPTLAWKTHHLQIVSEGLPALAPTVGPGAELSCDGGSHARRQDSAGQTTPSPRCSRKRSQGPGGLAARQSSPLRIPSGMPRALPVSSRTLPPLKSDDTGRRHAGNPRGEERRMALPGQSAGAATTPRQHPSRAPRRSAIAVSAISIPAGATLIRLHQL